MTTPLPLHTTERSALVLRPAMSGVRSEVAATKPVASCVTPQVDPPAPLPISVQLLMVARYTVDPYSTYEHSSVPGLLFVHFSSFIFFSYFSFPHPPIPLIYFLYRTFRSFK